MQSQKRDELRSWSADDRAEFAKWSRGVIALYGAIIVVLAVGFGAYRLSGAGDHHAVPGSLTAAETAAVSKQAP
jgi:hypothetical protein